MKFIVVWLLLLLAIFSSSFVSAELLVFTYPTDDGFSVFSGAEDFSLCQCQFEADSVIVSNNGQFTDRFTVSVSDSELVSLSENVFEVLPGDSHELFFYLQAPCDVEFSNKDFSIEISDIFGESVVVSKSLSVSQCQNLLASLSSSASVINPCQNIDYSVVVENTGAFTETYDVFFGESSDGVFSVGSFSPSSQTIVIPPDYFGVVNSTLFLDCSLYGDFSVPFSVVARQNDLVADLSHNLTVRRNYNFSLSSSDTSVCARDYSVASFTISNEGSVFNEYNLSLDGSSFAFLSDYLINLSPGESKDVLISFNPGSADVGSNNFTISATSKFGDMSSSSSFIVDVSECDGVSVNIISDEDIYQCDGLVSLPVVVENTGSRSANFWVGVSGSDYAFISDELVSLDAGKSSELVLSIDVPDNISINDSVSVNAGIGDLLSSHDAIEVSILSSRDCYKPSILNDFPSVSYLDSFVPVTLFNSGLKEAVYEIVYVGNPWFALNVSPIYASLISLEEFNFNLDMYQTGEDVGFVYDSSFSVKAYVGDDTFTYNLPFSVSVVHATYYEKFVEFVDSYPCRFASIVLLIVILLFVLLLIFSPPRRLGRGRNIPLLLILLLGWIIAVYIAFSFFGSPLPLQNHVSQGDDPLTIRLAQGDSYLLNLSDYFSDPDDDVLTFEITPISDVDVVLSDNIVEFTPDNDFAGSRRFRISASDGLGGITESPRMHLEVVPIIKYDFFVFYNRYCLSLNLILLLVVALLIYLLCSRGKKVDSKKKFKGKKPVGRKSKKKISSFGNEIVDLSKVSARSPRKAKHKKVSSKKTSKKKSVKSNSKSLEKSKKLK